jgi:hypothetical protein
MDLGARLIFRVERGQVSSGKARGGEGGERVRMRRKKISSRKCHSRITATSQFEPIYTKKKKKKPHTP